MAASAPVCGCFGRICHGGMVRCFWAGAAMMPLGAEGGCISGGCDGGCVPGAMGKADMVSLYKHLSTKMFFPTFLMRKCSWWTKLTHFLWCLDPEMALARSNALHIFHRCGLRPQPCSPSCEAVVPAGA